MRRCNHGEKRKNHEGKGGEEMKGTSLLWTAICREAMIIYVAVAIVREVWVFIIRKRKKVKVFGGLDIAQTVIDYLIIILLPIFIITDIYNPTPSSLWSAILWVVITLLYGIAVVGQLSYLQ